jgi:hypothetical protein
MSLLHTQLMLLTSHKHYINGVLVVHSHLFSPEQDAELPFKAHAHTNFELLTFALLSNTTSVLADSIDVPHLLQQMRDEVWGALSAAQAADITCRLNPSRAPPAA